MDITSEQHFRFKCSNYKALWLLFLGFTGVPLLMLLNPKSPLILYFVILLAPMALVLLLLIKKGKKQEDITLAADHLVSKRFGTAYFKDIESITSSILLARPNLKITLLDGTRMQWIPITNRAGNPNFENLKAFLEAFSAAILAYSNPKRAEPTQKVVAYPKTSFMEATGETLQQTFSLKEKDGSSTGPSKQDKPDDLGINSEEPHGDKAQASTQQSNKSRLKADIQSAKKRNHNIPKVVIPFSLALGILVFAKTYFTGKIKQKKQSEVANMFKESRAHNARLKQKVRSLIPAYQKAKGPFYFLTNDATASLHYLPKIAPPNSHNGPLSYVFESDSLERLLKSPDSMQWYMVVQTGSGEVYPLTKTLLNSNDSTDTYVYFAEVVPAVKRPNRRNYTKTQKPGGPDSLPTRLSFVVPFYPNNTIENDLKRGIMGYKMFLSLLRLHPKTTKFYMAARKGEGKMNAAFFEKVVRTIKADLHKQGAPDNLLPAWHKP